MAASLNIYYASDLDQPGVEESSLTYLTYDSRCRTKSRIQDLGVTVRTCTGEPKGQARSERKACVDHLE
eukprot:1266133-Rhodomonas_salina.1